MYLSKRDVRRLLPDVGDERMEVPTQDRVPNGAPSKDRPLECTVVEVNRAHLWYRVKFKDTGLHECYKVPQLAPPGGGAK